MPSESLASLSSEAREIKVVHQTPTKASNSSRVEIDSEQDVVVNSPSSIQIHPLGVTRHDEKDMARMGRKPQLRRNFRQVSAISFVCVMVSTWEVLFLANSQGLTDGGLAGLFWSYVWTLIDFALIAASLAEMASMAPTSGGMYHWVSEFAPPEYQRFLSYVTGKMQAYKIKSSVFISC